MVVGNQGVLVVDVVDFTVGQVGEEIAQAE